MRNKRPAQLALMLLLIGTVIGSVYGAYLTYKSYVEIYGVIHPLGEIETDIKQMLPIEGLETREDYIGEVRVWTYSNDTELILQLAQVSQIVSNFREFTVKVCLPLDMIFVIDLTGSMFQYMDAIKKNLTNIVGLLSLTYKTPLRFGVVGFKDFEGEIVQLSLTDDYEAVKAFINSLTAETGAEDPQGHYLGLGAALNDFNLHSTIANDKVVVFISDAQAGYNNLASFVEAKEKADEMAELGIKIDAVLCGSDQPPENWQLQYYANVTGGQFIRPEGQKLIYSGVTSHPTWIVKLTPITPFDSFHLRLNSSTPCQKEEYYTFYVYVYFYAKAIESHERFCIELMARLEKDQPLSPPRQ